jgi:hypothetical protein
LSTEALADGVPWSEEMFATALASPEPETPMGELPAPGIAPWAALSTLTLASGLAASLPSTAEASPPELKEAVPPPLADRLPVEVESPVTWVTPPLSVEIEAVEAFADWDWAEPSPVELALAPALESALRLEPGADWEAAAAASADDAAEPPPLEVVLEMEPVLACTEPDWEAWASADAFAAAPAVPSPAEAAPVPAAAAAAVELPLDDALPVASPLAVPSAVPPPEVLVLEPVLVEALTEPPLPGEAVPFADELVAAEPVPDTLALPPAPVLAASEAASACWLRRCSEDGSNPVGAAARAKANALAVAIRISFDRNFDMVHSFLSVCRSYLSVGSGYQTRNGNWQIGPCAGRWLPLY